MPDVYIIMGGNNTGKSTIIRALSGYKGKVTREIELTNGEVINVFICENALQEKDMTVTDLLDESNGCENILVAMHINGNVRGSAYTLINDLIKLRCHISRVVVLVEEDMRQRINENLQGIGGLPEPLFIVPKSAPANTITAHIRREWEWQ